MHSPVRSIVFGRTSAVSLTKGSEAFVSNEISSLCCLLNADLNLFEETDVLTAPFLPSLSSVETFSLFLVSANLPASTRNECKRNSLRFRRCVRVSGLFLFLCLGRFVIYFFVAFSFPFASRSIFSRKLLATSASDTARAASGDFVTLATSNSLKSSGFAH